jgi:hypothetical protein
MAMPMGGGLDINALAGKLGEINDEEEAERLKKEEFEKKRKLHYKNEFMMAQAMKNRVDDDEDEDENEDQIN